MVHVGPGHDYVVDRFDVEGGKDHDWFLHGMCEQEGTLLTSIPMDRSIVTLVPAWGGKNMPKTQYDTDPRLSHAYSFLHDVKTGAASGLWTATWRYNGAGLRTHIFSQPGTLVFRFRSPSIRLAGEDENKLDNFFHTGIMQRHSGKPSTFLSVHEPFRNDPWIKSARLKGKFLLIRYTLDGLAVEDRVKMIDGEIEVISSAGWKYSSGVY
jgi:hypothetical protein